MSAAGSNRRIRLTRMSGGVGGCRGAIPVTRPDRLWAVLLVSFVRDPGPSAGDDHNAESNSKLPGNSRVGPVICSLPVFHS